MCVSCLCTSVVCCAMVIAVLISAARDREKLIEGLLSRDVHEFRGDTVVKAGKTAQQRAMEKWRSKGDK